MSIMPAGSYANWYDLNFNYRDKTYQCGNTVVHYTSHLLNSSPPSATYMHQWTGFALVQVMVCRQAITWTNAAILSIESLGTNINEISKQNFSFPEMHLKILSANW